MSRSLILIALVALIAVPASAFAMTPELSAAWGWGWGGSADSQQGRFSLDPAMDISGVISVPVGPLNWGEFHYTWQDAGMSRSGAGYHQHVTDVQVHKFQLAGLRALKPGNVQPFLLGGIGATWFNPTESAVDIDGTTYFLDSSWMLSFMIGAGAKIWLGQEEKVGLRLQIRTMPSLYNSSGGIWVGTGGGGVSVSGNAIWQWDVTAGLSIKLGG
jgi:hypothetical protein